MPQSRIVRWKPWSGDGLEHVELQHLGDAVNVHSVAIGEDDGAGFGVHYHLLLRPGWEFHNLTLDTARPGFPQLSLSRRNRSWTNVTTGAALPELNGCIDIDISATPFTSSLPIHRLALQEGESAEILVAHLAAPDFVPKPMRQRYTCISQSLYRFESLDGTGFAADLEVDGDGMVVNYPGLFRRVGGRSTKAVATREARPPRGDPSTDLRPGWFTTDVASTIRMDAAGIYEWRIAGVPTRYNGASSHSKSGHQGELSHTGKLNHMVFFENQPYQLPCIPSFGRVNRVPRRQAGGMVVGGTGE